MIEGDLTIKQILRGKKEEKRKHKKVKESIMFDQFNSMPVSLHRYFEWQFLHLTGQPLILKARDTSSGISLNTTLQSIYFIFYYKLFFSVQSVYLCSN